jgi:threonine aldolase
VIERVDLRSDTVTQPTDAMRAAIASAVVGDDGHGEDPTISDLESRFARLVGKDAAIFVPSGVMGNQIAVRILTRPGDVVIAGANQHLVGFEMGASARNASIQFDLVDDECGVLDVDEVAERLSAELDHRPRVTVVAIENTHMHAGGVPWSGAQTAKLRGAIGDRQLHLDGARLFNASVATGESMAELASSSTTVMCCLSKGLCAPVGSLLAGSSDLIEQAHVERKRLGGSMRQAGFLAAAGIVALDSMVARLADDHARARRLADCFADRFPDSRYDPATCRTNIVSFNHPRARDLVGALASQGVLGDTVSPRRVRFVTHADIDDTMVDHAIAAIRSVELD